ncbi:hypothetical protein QJS04_geneDACA002182 [Acorus gramineus]|uniref:C2H2-type domain-containing protein n=1 Tax=Acorus gramineus TaxID=55184 RepID=A0AAV9AAM1_ACOGR|nr:hypothetical protein QJS04_geneDACA002182 [Acorus gramineus]
MNPSSSVTINTSSFQEMYISSMEDDNMIISSNNNTIHSTTLLYNLAILRDKVHHMQSLVHLIVVDDHQPAQSSSREAIVGVGALVQDVISAASSMMFTCQQMSQSAAADAEIIEVGAVDILAKYTHHCHVCGKGFKRDANLRMHMRAHGDEYKTHAALSNPAKGKGCAGPTRRRYSCPHEGCRWNRQHPKFQPLKSMICVKNHYKRSHCPKMYVCNRCNQKQFSVLSDLRTHEKNCGDLKWRCTCGTTFSRKDKLMGHVTLFVGHSPAAASDCGVLLN